MAASEARLRRPARAAGQAQVELRIAAPGAAWAARVMREAARAWVRASETFSLSLVTDREMRRLNRAWRGKDHATDVLSWPGSEVVISLETARRQAREGGWPLRVELRRLLAHGMLHCRGYDHETPREAARMALAEKKLLGEEGMVGDSLPQRDRAQGALRGAASPSHKRRRAAPERPKKKNFHAVPNRRVSR